MIRAIELFAGAGGFAIGLEKAGMDCVMLNEIDKNACQTLLKNRPHWNVIEEDIKKIDFKKYFGNVEIVTGGFPCQSFSYAGKGLGMDDARGTLFFEFARAIKEVKPIVFLGENVPGLISHDKGQTLTTVLSILDGLGYHVQFKVLNAVNFNVPQKRKRIFIVGVKKDSHIDYEFPQPNENQYTLRDALKAGNLYQTDVPHSLGYVYPTRKKEIMSLVPQGGCWKHLSVDIQKEYMLASYYASGGKTGMARRLSWNEPCLTLTCSPSQKQTERCHPTETRPLTVREYARIQSFPDEWEFNGSVASQYKQIGNALPVNLACEIGKSLMVALN
jgi:DNA (cytosine-5)-methyltransferase 1